MAQEYKVVLKHADEPGYTPDIECYLRHGGYDTLKKALAIQPKHLPDGKKLSGPEQIREDVKISGLRGRGGAENKSHEPVDVADGKITLPSKQKVLTSMEELIHQFMLVTEGVNCPPGEVYFGHENPKGELGFYINSRGGGVPYRLKIRAPSFINLSILGELMPGAMISDVPVILGSLDFVMGESDR